MNCQSRMRKQPRNINGRLAVYIRTATGLARIIGEVREDIRVLLAKAQRCSQAFRHLSLSSSGWSRKPVIRNLIHWLHVSDTEKLRQPLWMKRRVFVALRSTSTNIKVMHISTVNISQTMTNGANIHIAQNIKSHVSFGLVYLELILTYCKGQFGCMSGVSPNILVFLFVHIGRESF